MQKIVVTIFALTLTGALAVGCASSKPAGQDSPSNQPATKPAGEHPSGEHPSGEHPSGEHPSGEHPSESKPEGDPK